MSHPPISGIAPPSQQAWSGSVFLQGPGSTLSLLFVALPKAALRSAPTRAAPPAAVLESNLLLISTPSLLFVALPEAVPQSAPPAPAPLVAVLESKFSLISYNDPI